LEDLGVGGRIISGRNRISCGLDFLVQDSDKWRGVVNTVMNLLVP
jgi:hypothetical protein